MRHLRDGAWRAHLVDFIIGALVVLLICYLLVIAASVVLMAAPIWIVGLALAIGVPLLRLGLLTASVRDGQGIHRLGLLRETSDGVEFIPDAAMAARRWSPALVGFLAVMGYALGTALAFMAVEQMQLVRPEVHGLPHQLVYPAMVAPVWLVRFLYGPLHNFGVRRLDEAVRQHISRLTSGGSASARSPDTRRPDLGPARAVALLLGDLEAYWGGTRLAAGLADLRQLLELAERDPAEAPRALSAASGLERQAKTLLEITQRHGAYRKWVQEHEPLVTATGFSTWAEQLALIEAAIEGPGLLADVRSGQYARASQRLEEIAKMLGLLSFMMQAEQSTSRRADYRGPKPGSERREGQQQARQERREHKEPPPGESGSRRQDGGPNQEQRASAGVKAHDLAWARGVLHIPESATFEEARKAHRHLVKFFHPDAGNVSDDLAMKEINEAWDLVAAHLRPPGE